MGEVPAVFSCLLCKFEISDANHTVQLSNAQTTSGKNNSARMIRDILLQMSRDHHYRQNAAGEFPPSLDGVVHLNEISENVKLCLPCVNLLIEYEDLCLRLQEIRSLMDQGIETFVKLVDRKRDVLKSTTKANRQPIVKKDSCDLADEKEKADQPVAETVPKTTQVDQQRVVFEKNKSQFENENRCEFCAKVEQTEDELSAHQARCSSGWEKPYSCPVCDARFPKFYPRNIHVLETHCFDRPYVCSMCAKNFKSRYRLSEHVKSCRGAGSKLPVDTVSCGECGKKFGTARQLTVHAKLIHAPDDEDKWKHACQECGKRFYKKANFDSHLLKHSSAKNVRCPLCNKSFKRMKALHVHHKTHHQRQNNDESATAVHLCSFCGKEFATQTGLRLHLAKHTGAEYVKRKHQCTTCSKTFKCQADLKAHVVVHSKEKPFACTLCSSAFSQKSSLNDHMNIHNKTFQCAACHSCFARQRYLVRHQKSGCCTNQNNEAEEVVNQGHLLQQVAAAPDEQVANVVSDDVISANAAGEGGGGLVITTTNPNGMMEELQCVRIISDNMGGGGRTVRHTAKPHGARPRKKRHLRRCRVQVKTSKVVNVPHFPFAGKCG